MTPQRKFVFSIKTDRQVDGDRMNASLHNKVEAEAGQGAAFSACFQCGTCSGGCTNSERMDLSPRLLILMLQRGQWERLLNSNTLWMCSSCHICTARCPRGVRPADVIEAVKALALREGIENDSTRFSKAFVEIVKRHGILWEPELLQAYGGVKALLEQAELSVKLALKGKVPPIPERIDNPGRLASALEEAHQP
jgi:heterodisulfide reductase subunit C